MTLQKINFTEVGVFSLSPGISVLVREEDEEEEEGVLTVIQCLSVKL